MARNWKSWRNRAALLGLAMSLAATNGCLWLAASAAIGGAAGAGYVYYNGKVTRPYNAHLNDVWAASHSALAELGMRVESEGRDESSAEIHSRLANGDKVRVYFNVRDSKIPAEGMVTVVGIRVGSFAGDEAASVRILNQIDLHLTHPAAAVSKPNGQPPTGGWNPIVQTKATEPPLLAPEPVPAKKDK
ncbi:MAG TPA: DUF3568 family protein [Gemmataceae bacterium]|nr:DUF3568 family protein [Gemmataceae bacterium]